ncbi:MAG TPA: hypothetical protein VN698_00020 [Bacteroidia bacterium]|nr:hypothetical protein [Bacteroidia bacterium]
MEPLKIGQKIYYTGDMANASDFGIITEVFEPTKYTYWMYKIKFDSGKERKVEAYGFNKSPGQRFKTIEQYNQEREAAMEKLYQSFPHLRKTA